MTRISKTNFVGIAVSAAAFVVSSAFVVGCGQPPTATHPAPPASVPGLVGNQPVNPTNIAQNAQGLNDLGQFSAAQQAQINALLGNYTGTFAGLDDNGDPIHQNYTLTLSKGTSPSVPGKTFVAATFSSSGNMNMTSIMQTTYLAATWGASGPTYSFVSLAQNVPSIYAGSSVLLAVQLTLNSANQFDPTQSPVVRIVDSVSLQDVVGFYNDLQRH